MMQDFVLMLLAAFSVGIVGSFHCVGMCGPIALALPIHRYSSFQKFIAVAFYNVGRASTYFGLGLVFGLLGQSFSLFKIQQYTSIVAGVFILYVLIFSTMGFLQTSWFSQVSLRIKNQLGALLKAEKTPFTFFPIGIVNGFLPCGLVYVAIAGAVSTNDVLWSGSYMFAFGLGTMPIMALTMIFGKYISDSLRSKINRITPYLIGLMAILLIVRGLNLGIPYLSPKHEAGHTSCCHR